MRPVPLKPTKDQLTAGVAALKGRPLTTDARIARAVIDIYTSMVALAPAAKAGGLTHKQQQGLELIADFIDDHGQAPRLIDVANLMGMHKAAAYRMIKNMQARGYVRRGAGWRNLVVLKRYDGTPVKTPVTSQE